MRTELKVFMALSRGSLTRLEILYEIDRKALRKIYERPNRFEIWEAIDSLLKCGVIEKLPTDHSAEDWEPRYSRLLGD